MSVRVMTAVFERYPNGGGEMLLALALADHAHDDGTRIFPYIKSLAEKTRQSTRSVQYQLRKMEESGWLILVNAGNGGRNQPNEYQINSDWLKGAEIAPLKKGANDDTKGCNPQQERVQSTTERVQPIAPAYNHHEPSDNHKEPSLPKDPVKDGFERFWLVYPKKRGRQEAEKAWKKVKPIEYDEVIAAVAIHRACKEWIKDGGQFIPHPASWLNGRRWEDEVEGNSKSGATKHGNFDKQNYGSGIGADGSF
jgi:hypothetical protein